MEEIKNFIFHFIKLQIQWSEISHQEKVLYKIFYNHFSDLYIQEDNRERIINLIKDNYLLNINLEEHFIWINDIQIWYWSQNNDVSSEKIDSIILKNFKWFKHSSQENWNTGLIIPFNNRLNIIFWSNGTGKTSISEAIEYSLTNNIKESSKRWFSKVEDYLWNFDHPQILLQNNVQIQQSNYFDRYIFEKNRIDDFWRLKSLWKIDRNTLLSTLFWLDQLQFFVNKLPINIDAKINETILSNQIWNNQMREKEKEINLKDESLLQKMEQLEHLKIEVWKNNIQELTWYKKTLGEERTELESWWKKIKFIDIESLKKVNNYALTLFEISNLEQEILAKTPKINDTIIKLYQYIKDNDFDDLSHCPVCKTPVNLTNQNPFTYPKHQLEEISDYTELQKKLEIKKNDIAITDKIFLEIHNMLWLIRDESKKNKNELIEAFNQIYTHTEANLIHYYTTKIEEINDIYQQITEFNNKLSTYHERIKPRIETINNIIDKITLAIGLDEEINQIKVLKSSLDDEIEILKSNVDIENSNNLKLREFGPKYREFYNKLVSFKNWIFQSELDNIVNDVKKYYNILNSHDEIDQLIDNIDFSPEDGSIQISFCHRNENYNILNILSEGHLKCFGLAILFARAKKHNPKFLLFDDVINAIDTDHRWNIVNLISHNDFSDVQFIITTHDRFFDDLLNNSTEFKDIEIDRYILQFSNWKWVILIPYKTNFESKVQYFIEHEDFRWAISHSRIWLENLILKNFDYMVNNVNLKKGRITNLQFKDIFDNNFRKLIDERKQAIKDQYSEKQKKEIENFKNQWKKIEIAKKLKELYNKRDELLKKQDEIIAIIDYFNEDKWLNRKILNQENHYLNDTELDLRWITFDIKKQKVIEMKDKILLLKSLILKA
jgi:DNA sulfur modification protein DndD